MDNSLSLGFLNDFKSANSLSTISDMSLLINKDNILISYLNENDIQFIDFNSLFRKSNEDDQDIKQRQIQFMEKLSSYQNIVIDKENSLFKLDKHQNLYYNLYDDFYGKACMLIYFKKYPILKECNRVVAQFGQKDIKFDYKKLPKQMIRYDSMLFKNNLSIIDIEMPNFIKKIEKQVFKGCSNLKNIQFSNSISTINDEAFSDCSSLISVDLSLTNVSDINEKVFNNCTSLKTVILPSTTKSISESAFDGCTNLELIDCSNNMQMIDIQISEKSTINQKCKILMPNDIYPFQYPYLNPVVQKMLVRAKTRQIDRV